MTLYSQGVNQSAQGTDKVATILNCHLAAGRIGRTGMGPFSLTGQPNAMGGREVGGLANQLAAHMGFSPPRFDRVRRFWKAPNMAQHEGLKAVSLFDAIDQGEIKALWIMGTNPAVSLPRADMVVRALRKLDLCVISENVVSNDTVNAAHTVLLPATAGAKRTVRLPIPNGAFRVSAPFCHRPAKPSKTGGRSAKSPKGSASQASIMPMPRRSLLNMRPCRHLKNDGSRDFDLSGLTHLSAQDYDAMAPIQWPCRKDKSGAQRLFADGGFFTASGKRGCRKSLRRSSPMCPR